MEITIHKDVQELLEELNALGPSIVFGGYLRDRIFDNLPNDVDIITNIPLDILEQKYIHEEKAKSRITNTGYDIFSFKMDRTDKIFVEIVTTKEDIFEKSKLADYTINSLMYDGKDVIDTENGLEDIKNKIIREVDINIVKNDLKTRPFLWLKTLRLASVNGFDLSNEVFNALNENKQSITEISNEIMQTEGHKTLNGINPFKAIKYLSDMGFISSFDIKDINEIKYKIQPQQQLCLLAILSNKKVIDEFCSFYHFQQDLIDKYDKLYNFYFSDDKVPSRFRHQIITIKKLVTKIQEVVS